MKLSFVLPASLSIIPISCAPLAAPALIPSGLAKYNTLPSAYTLTAYSPHNSTYHGLRVNYLQLFAATVNNTCPFTDSSAAICPNGTQSAFSSTLNPLSAVAGGQTLYAAPNGQLRITPPHVRSFPNASVPSFYGWTWYALPVDQQPLQHCNGSNPEYDCEPASGYWDFRANESAREGGVRACKTLREKREIVELWVVTEGFDRRDCVELMGLGTHSYMGVNPPVYAY